MTTNSTPAGRHVRLLSAEGSSESSLQDSILELNELKAQLKAEVKALPPPPPYGMHLQGTKCDSIHA
jgi:hypothetical protein